jgi:NhaP-type Na+/H+ and K+/H+ antiporter
MTDGELILAGGALLAAGLGASLLASSFRVPALVLVLGAGMLIGSDGTGWIDFADYELARTIGVIALSLILFEGGLASGWREIGPVLRPAISLAFFGTILTAVMTGLVAPGCSTSPPSRASCWARCWPPPTRPRSSRCCERRPCVVTSRGPWRGSRA